VARFRVGVLENLINSRFGPAPLINASYLTAAACGIDSFWVPDHLNSLFPRSICTPQHLGVGRLAPMAGDLDRRARAAHAPRYRPLRRRMVSGFPVQTAGLFPGPRHGAGGCLRRRARPAGSHTGSLLGRLDRSKP
jgi:hypothetical protein